MVQSSSFLVLCALRFFGSVAAHSWIEQMQVIGSNGTFTGNYGYPRGYVARTDPGFTGNSDMYLLPALSSGRLRINDSDLLCHPSQRTPNYSANYPKLAVSPGDWVAMKYLENGHVTQPWVQAGKPSGGGTVYVFATANPDSQAKIVDVMQWTTDGTGGDGKGRLIAAQNFDDGRCHQISNSAISMFRQQANADRVEGQPTSQIEQWCETDVQIPTDMTGSSLTAYWIWQWPTAVGTVGAPYGKDEYYTTCMDFDVSASTGSGTSHVAGAAVGAGSVAAPSFKLSQQDPQQNAVSSFSSRTAYAPTPTVITADQKLNAANVKLASAQAITTLYTLPGATYVNPSGTTYVLEPQGTALQIDGTLAAYVNCQNAMMTGTSAPVCSGASTSAAAANSAATSAPAASSHSTLIATTLPASTTAASAAVAPTTVTQLVPTTVFVIVTPSTTQHAVVEADSSTATAIANFGRRRRTLQRL